MGDRAGSRDSAWASIAAEDPIRVVHRPGHGVTIADIFPRGTPAAMRALLDSGADLSGDLRHQAERLTC